MLYCPKQGSILSCWTTAVYLKQRILLLGKTWKRNKIVSHIGHKCIEKQGSGGDNRQGTRDFTDIVDEIAKSCLLLMDYVTAFYLVSLRTKTCIRVAHYP